MANPKRKHSKARTGHRRSQYKVKNVPTPTECPNCSNAKLQHRACPTCGHYRGRAVIETADAL
ncbi:50S ribosomal protein L32 [Rubrivirga sp. IMCC45206]|uniref:50S ribosomal protein L32 n=1 Tax=Rubrivirga sp. IMCC45206 TaxID=3391614 RepID=UPI00398FC6B6